MHMFHSVNEHLLESRYVDQVFRIKVYQPTSQESHSESYPVLYTTDGDDLFAALLTFSRILQAHGEVPRFILVGIGYENSSAAGLLRMRDLLTHRIRRYFHTEIQRDALRDTAHGITDLQVVT